ncbi:hypothetical protein [Chryseolinea sp. H1M3-3]|uniref:hypothetical protein n=1 Tax=Chryseolinea sp. H1M3-3 TaxID=3034144 RepID=UPI0023EC9877|nr:hypothetical protein [Chryseolinea sp. H1M3-3]
MIFKLSDLEGIKAGKITLAFRKWKKPTVRKGSLIRTEIAVVEISDVSEISLTGITDRDAVSAGFDSAESLLKSLNKVNEGTIYKIKVHYYSEDPRIALRGQTTLTENDFQLLKKKLERLDSHDKAGPWTLTVLKTIRDNPKLRAADLADKLNRKKDELKINIRKLKNLGLTTSHEVGYTISPLGEHFLNRRHG